MNVEAAHWFQQATEDLKTAQILFDAERFGPCAFFCQQSSEKALKALVYNTGERPWGHSVPSLLDQACAILRLEPGRAPVSEAEALDEHYIRPRYPDARTWTETGYDRDTAEDALRQARSVSTFVQENLRNA